MKVDVCPGCDTAEAEVLDTANGFPTLIGGEVFEQPPYSLLRCRRCGLYYKSDVTDVARLSRLYDLVDFRNWESPKLYPTERLTIEVLRQIPLGGTILDFGCSSGRLLESLVPDYKCMGFEINADAAAIAKSKGIQMLNSPSDAGTSSLDALVLVDVFEHLPHPTQTISELVKLIKPGGRLILVTGNADSGAFQEDLAHSWYMRSNQHLLMFSKAYAQFLAEKLGAKLAGWTEASHYEYPWTNRLWQRARRFAFQTFHGQKRPVYAPLIAITPVLRRAQHWSETPPFTCSNDHVVATFQMDGHN
jgi:2-polyprenyl-3-methyl-5-hydroxy-6-metoxy-1,4-benzoquinol methylase